MKSLYEQLGGTYHWEGDYLIPDLALSDEDERPVGIWGQRHERWLRQKHRALCHNLMFTYKLHVHLAEVDERAEDMFTQLTAEMAKREGMTEDMKASDQMEWVMRMNRIRARAEEIIYSKIVNNL